MSGREVEAGVGGAAVGADLVALLDVQGGRSVARRQGAAVGGLVELLGTVGAGHEHALEGRDLGQHALDRGAHLGVVDAGVRAEDDRPAGATGAVAEVLREHLAPA